MGRGGGVVSMLACDSGGPSSNPAKAVKCCLKRTKMSTKRPGLAHLINFTLLALCT